MWHGGFPVHDIGAGLLESPAGVAPELNRDDGIRCAVRDRDGKLAGAIKLELEPLDRRDAESLAIRVADLPDDVPVSAARRQGQWCPGCEADEATLRIQRVEEREQVELVGPAPV